MTSHGMWKTRNELIAMGEVIGRGCGLVLWVGSFGEGVWLSAVGGSIGKSCGLVPWVGLLGRGVASGQWEGSVSKAWDLLRKGIVS